MAADPMPPKLRSWLWGLCREIPENASLPKGYGIVRLRWRRASKIVAWFPLSWVLCLALDVRAYLKYGWIAWGDRNFQRAMQEAWDKGFEDGRKYERESQTAHILNKAAELDS